ncbi:MAG: LuxR C-terminal-related transcriptional regulator [Erythrobacter sp.]
MQITAQNATRITLHIIDTCSNQRAGIASSIYALGHHAEVYGNISELTAHPPRSGIIIARDDASMGGVTAIIECMVKLGIWLPVIAVDEQPLPARIVQAIKAGALDYLPLPIDQERLERTLARVSLEAEAYSVQKRRMIDARGRIKSLTVREREVLDLLTDGGSNKEIARALEISPRTVEIHRSNMMTKLGARHAAEAVRFRLEANINVSAAA